MAWDSFSFFLLRLLLLPLLSFRSSQSGLRSLAGINDQVTCHIKAPHVLFLLPLFLPASSYHHYTENHQGFLLPNSRSYPDGTALLTGVLPRHPLDWMERICPALSSIDSSSICILASFSGVKISHTRAVSSVLN